MVPSIHHESLNVLQFVLETAVARGFAFRDIAAFLLLNTLAIPVVEIALAPCASGMGLQHVLRRMGIGFAHAAAPCCTSHLGLVAVCVILA